MSTYDDFAIVNVKILKYILKNDNILTKHQILSKFPDNKYQTLHRLETMSKPKGLYFKPGEEETQYLEESYIWTKDSNGFDKIKYTGNFSLTTNGKSYLLDYVLHNRRNIFWEIIRSFFFPSLVALLVSAIANYLFP